MKTQFQNRNEEFFKLSAAASDEITNKFTDAREQQFHDSIREILVCIDLFVSLKVGLFIEFIISRHSCCKLIYCKSFVVFRAKKAQNWI